MRGEAGMIRAAAVLAVSLLWPGPGIDAQQAVPSLTLTDALERASIHSPDYRSAVAGMRLAGPQGRQAWGAFLPSLSLDLGTGGSFSRFEVAEDIFGNTVPNPEVVTRPSYASNQGISTTLTLFEGGKRFADLKAAGFRADSRGREAAAELVRVHAEVERAFIGAQRQEALLITEREVLEGRIRDREATQRLFGIASRTRADVLAAELGVQRQEREVALAESERDKSLLILVRVIGDPSLDSPTLAASEPELTDPSALNEEALVNAAVGDNPTVSRTAADLEASRAALSAARSARWPTLRLNGSLRRSAQRSNTAALFDVTPKDQTFGSVGLQITIPIFRQFQTSFQIAEAQVTLSQADETLRRVRLEKEEEVRSGLIDLRNAYQTAQINQRALEVAEERVRLVREEYRLAVKSIEDLLDAVDAAATARRDLVNSRYDYVTSRIDLEEAVGLPLTEAGTSGMDPGTGFGPGSL